MLADDKTPHFDKVGGGQGEALNVPAEIREFLVNSLQRHVCGCVRIWGVVVSGVGGVVGESRVFVSRTGSRERAKFYQQLLDTKTGERLR